MNAKTESGDAVPGLLARAGALHLIGAVLERGAMLDEAGLRGSPAERAEARGLADLTLRRLGQIDDALGRFVGRMPKPPVNHVLRLMAAELIFAGTAPHAAVDLAVRLVKRVRGAAKLSGMVNAVGRRLAGHGAEIAAGQDAARLNTPPWLWKQLAADWGAAAARAMAMAHLVPAPHDLTLANQADAAPLAAEIGAEVLETGSLRLAGRPQISTLPGFAEGAWWAQDAAAALPARLIPEPQAKRVLDLCAAPGGKTMQLAAAGARVTALDISAGRMARLGENLARTGLAAECVVADALEWAPDLAVAEPFDAILLDAPCSASGTIRRHPDLPHRQARGRNSRQNASDLKALTSLQARLLDRAAGWLAPGGVLVFCTCSLVKAEGEDQARRFLDRAQGFERLPAEPGEAGIPADFLTPSGDLRTRPDFWGERGGIDGFFAARFRRGS
ncbi:MAG: RsmB/NOP family class I SAM-dependent RNA methyltransferase [Alphaproteobacteria bacterium]